MLLFFVKGNSLVFINKVVFQRIGIFRPSNNIVLPGQAMVPSYLPLKLVSFFLKDLLLGFRAPGLDCYPGIEGGSVLGRLGLLLVENDGFFFTGDGVLVDDTFLDVGLRGKLIHDVEHDRFQDGT